MIPLLRLPGASVMHPKRAIVADWLAQWLLGVDPDSHASPIFLREKASTSIQTPNFQICLLCVDTFFATAAIALCGLRCVDLFTYGGDGTTEGVWCAVSTI